MSITREKRKKKSPQIEAFSSLLFSFLDARLTRWPIGRRRRRHCAARPLVVRILIGRDATHTTHPETTTTEEEERWKASEAA